MCLCFVKIAEFLFFLVTDEIQCVFGCVVTVRLVEYTHIMLSLSFTGTHKHIHAHTQLLLQRPLSSFDGSVWVNIRFRRHFNLVRMYWCDRQT